MTSPDRRLFARASTRRRPDAVRRLLLLVAAVSVVSLATVGAGLASAGATPMTSMPTGSMPTGSMPTGLIGTATAGSAAPGASAAKSELTVPKAIVLGLVEGITEFLPISSTGHLHVAEQLLDVGTTDATRDATDSYTVIIQIGAIAAVLIISWRRVMEVFAGLIGRSAPGRRLLVSLIAAFVPAAVIGLIGDKLITKHLLKTAPIAAAWIVGGGVILWLAPRYRKARGAGHALESLTVRQAVIIGAAQSLALWPGVSRSLVTILAAVLLGLSLSAAVEFSFLLGLLTLGAATVYKVAKDGSLVFDTFGTTSPLVGIVVAFLAAAVAVKWMIAYLNRHDLTVFAIYRIVIGAVTLALLATAAL